MRTLDLSQTSKALSQQSRLELEHYRSSASQARAFNKSAWAYLLGPAHTASLANSEAFAAKTLAAPSLKCGGSAIGRRAAREGHRINRASADRMLRSLDEIFAAASGLPATDPALISIRRSITRMQAHLSVKH